MRETQASVAEWACVTFGPLTSSARAAVRANEEMAELLRAITGDGRRAPAEMADVLICLYRLASHCGVDLHAEVDRKMAVNRARKWVSDGTGCGYHLKE